MRILIDIGHPAHVHLFMPMAKELEKKGHKIFFSCREIPVAQRLLEANNYSFLNYLLLLLLLLLFIIYIYCGDPKSIKLESSIMFYFKIKEIEYEDIS